MFHTCCETLHRSAGGGENESEWEEDSSEGGLIRHCVSPQPWREIDAHAVAWYATATWNSRSSCADSRPLKWRWEPISRTYYLCTHDIRTERSLWHIDHCFVIDHSPQSSPRRPVSLSTADSAARHSTTRLSAWMDGCVSNHTIRIRPDFSYPIGYGRIADFMSLGIIPSILHPVNDVFSPAWLP